MINLKILKNILKLNYILLILIITASCVQIIVSYNNNQLKKIQEEELNFHSGKIEKCIDIENKNKRTISENIKLSKYCIDNFGAIR